ncbi:MAG TPA: hypothetical protein VFA67_06590 [Candidatus Sulfotelmatobacter sp.]|nr:hypothetical protein [Candidatus Sulfotelmatobacter sp.]
MKRVLQMMALIAALALPALCQNGRLSPEDQREFDKAYAKWVNDSRKNDRDDLAKDVRRMQDIMARNNISPDVPYDQLASPAYGQQGPYDNGEGRYNNNDYSQNGQNWGGQGRLSPEDQRDFDRYYSQWVNDSRRHDRDDADRDVRRMQDIMQRNNIPSDVPYDQIATSGRYNNGYNDNRYSRGGYGGYGQTRLSAEDQREFDKAYEKWVHDSRKNDRDDIKKDARKMQDIMARYNIPSDVPYDQIASPNANYRH